MDHLVTIDLSLLLGICVSIKRREKNTDRVKISDYSVFVRVVVDSRFCDAESGYRSAGGDMLLDTLKRFAHRIGMLRRHKKITTAPAAIDSLDAEFDTTWHGDHWQNLLASPLDARHYVMEDWAQPIGISPSHYAPEVQPPKRRRHR